MLIGLLVFWLVIGMLIGENRLNNLFLVGLQVIVWLVGWLGLVWLV